MRYALVCSAGAREENQDAAAAKEIPGGLVACVCDGLGGHRGGATAAKAALEAVLVSTGAPGERLTAANAAVVAAQGISQNPGMRTTAVVLLLQGGRAHWAHCGDSRLYRLRGGAIEQLTFDHSVPQALVRTGEIAREDIRHHEDRARLTRALGVADLRWDQGEDDALPGDIYLLVTDGLWEPVTEEQMLCSRCDDPQAYVRRLEELALERGDQDQDNYTALAVYL